MERWMKWAAWSAAGIVALVMAAALQIGGSIVWRRMEDNFYTGFSWVIMAASIGAAGMMLAQLPAQYRRHGIGEAIFGLFVAGLCALPGIALLIANAKRFL